MKGNSSKEMEMLTKENQRLKDMMLKIQMDITKCVNECISNLNKHLKESNDLVSQQLQQVIKKSKVNQNINELQLKNPIDPKNSDEMQEIFNTNTKKFYLFT